MSAPDPIDDFLGRDFGDVPDGVLKVALRQRTTRVLRRQRRQRTAAIIVLLCPVAVAVGWCIATLCKPQPSGDRSAPAPVVVVNSPAGQQPTVVQHKEPQPVTLTPLDQVLSPAQRLEVQARRDAAEQTVYLLQAGNTYFEEDDFASALRCYRQYLSLAGPEGLTVLSMDNWLLVTLKDARRKEQAHAE